MTNMTNLTTEQITETLERFRGYSWWMYYHPDGIKMFQKVTREIDGQTFSLKINTQGKTVAVLDGGVEIVYDATVIMVPPRENSLDNIEFAVQVCDCPTEYVQLAEKIKIFVLSFFQRAIAFTFFSRMHDKTITGIANDLIKITPKQTSQQPRP